MAESETSMDEKIIKIERVVFGGKGLSRDLEKITFVPLTLPGEIVRVRITKDKGDYYEAQAIDILEPNPARVAPSCSYFGVCGGCHLSHANYEKQIEIKLQILKETLARNTVKHPPIQTISSKPYGYRHRAQWKYDSAHRSLGFFEIHSNKVVDIQECLCLTPGMNQALKSLRSRVCRKPIAGLREIECYENENQQISVFFRPPGMEYPAQNEDLTISFRGYKFPMKPGIFLQVNPGMWRTMIQEVENHYQGISGQTALELYCGAGFFTVALAPLFHRMIACEENSEAVEYAKKHHQLKNVEWICNKAETYRFPAKFQAAIVDPPRAGLHRNVLTQLIDRKPEWITYISCDCTTIARDVKKLKEIYTIEKLTMLDLFPQTYHFETIALLKRR
jgi:23S rRNA (uracil1939-C5)-methyltransferase